MGLKVKAIERNVSFVKDGDPMIPITEMAVVGVTTAIRQLLAEAGGGGKHGLPPCARLQRDDYFFTRRTGNLPLMSVTRKVPLYRENCRLFSSVSL